MKRIKLLQHLRKHGCVILREGGKHTIVYNPASGRLSSLPRHTEIDDRLAMRICKDLMVSQP